jgi:hypothetical protein
MMPKKRFDLELVAAVHRLVADARSVRQVAHVLHVPRSTVTAVLRDHPGSLPVPVVEAERDLPARAVPPLPPQGRLLLHPWLREPSPLPPDLDVHPTVASLYADALAADPVRASELDVLAVAFDLPVPRVRAYLNALAAERVRARFDLTEDDPPAASARLTLPRALWEAGLVRLRDAFDVQEHEMAAARDRLLAVLPPTISPDQV